MGLILGGRASLAIVAGWLIDTNVISELRRPRPDRTTPVILEQARRGRGTLGDPPLDSGAASLFSCPSDALCAGSPAVARRKRRTRPRMTKLSFTPPPPAPSSSPMPASSAPCGSRFFSPHSHLETSPVVTPIYSANTAWLTPAFTRMARISAGARVSALVRQRSSKSRIVFWSTMPSSWRSVMDRCMAPDILQRYFLGITTSQAILVHDSSI